MNLPHLASHSACTGCMACIDACSKEALNSYVGADGHYYIHLDEKRCVGCLRCESTCPVVSDFQYSNSEICHCYAAWNKDDDIRQQSASGGVFAAMAAYVIDRQGVVVGAANIGTDVKHVTIEKKSDLPMLQGSKYTQSDCRGIYYQTIELLKNGRLVLFSGTGCQIAGLLSFLRKHTFTGHLITVDLICGGVPSKLLQQAFLKNEPHHLTRIVSYRTKEAGWKPKGFSYNLKAANSEGFVFDYAGLRNLITDGYGSELTNRYSCYKCRFAGLLRQSDFTIGDCWGVTQLPEQHTLGLSVMIAHSERAEKILTDLTSYMETVPASLTEVVKHNPRLVDGRKRYEHFPERRFISWFFSHCSYSTLKRIYASDYSSHSPWMILKVVRYIVKNILR